MNLLLFLCCDQKYFHVLSSVLKRFRMIVKEDVDMISADSAAFVFGGVDYTVDHYLGPVRNNLGVNGDGVARGSQSPGAGMTSPAFRAAAAGTVAGGFEGTQ